MADLQSYDLQTILSARDKVVSMPPDAPMGEPLPMQENIGRLRQVLGTTNFFDHLNDQAFARMTLAGIDDDTHAALWAIDAYHHAAKRGHTTSPDKHTIRMHKLREKALGSVNNYARNIKPRA